MLWYTNLSVAYPIIIYDNRNFYKNEKNKKYKEIMSKVFWTWIKIEIVWYQKYLNRYKWFTKSELKYLIDNKVYPDIWFYKLLEWKSWIWLILSNDRILLDSTLSSITDWDVYKEKKYIKKLTWDYAKLFELWENLKSWYIYCNKFPFNIYIQSIK